MYFYLHASFYGGISVYWKQRYEWSQLLDRVEKLQITLFSTVPSIYLWLAKSPDMKYQFEFVVGASAGGWLMDKELQRSANSKLGDGKNVRIAQAWGLSETTGAVTYTSAGESDDTGSIGPVIPNMEVRFVQFPFYALLMTKIPDLSVIRIVDDNDQVLFQNFWMWNVCHTNIHCAGRPTRTIRRIGCSRPHCDTGIL